MASSTRSRALSLFKTLHRSVQTVFRGDLRAMLIARDKIEAEFRKNRNLTDQTAIEELLKHGADCNKVLRESVVRAKPTDRGTYELEVRDEVLHDNRPFQEISREEWREAVRHMPRNCSQQQQQQQQNNKPAKEKT